MVQLEFFALYTFLDIPPTVPDNLFWGYYPWIMIGAAIIVCIYTRIKSGEEHWWIPMFTSRFTFRAVNLVYPVAFVALLLSHWVWESFTITNYVTKVPIYGLVALLIWGAVAYFEYKMVKDHEMIIHSTTTGEELENEYVEEIARKRNVMKSDYGYASSEEVKWYWIYSIIIVALVIVGNWIAQPVIAVTVLDQYTERNIQLFALAGIAVYYIGLWFYTKPTKNN